MKKWARGYLDSVDVRRVADWLSRRLDGALSRGEGRVNASAEHINGDVGYLETISDGVISGWAFSPSGVRELCLGIDGVLFRKFVPTVARPDVAAVHPNAPVCSGFAIDISRELQELTSIGRHPSEVTIAVTFDSALTSHVVGSPARIKRALVPSSLNMIGGASKAQDAESAPTAGGSASCVVQVPVVGLAIRGSIPAGLAPDAADSAIDLAPLDDVELGKLQVGIDQLCALVIAGRQRIVASVGGVSQHVSDAYEMDALSLLEVITGPSLFKRLAVGPIPAGFQRSLVGATTLLVQRRRLGGMYAKLDALCGGAVRNRDLVELYPATLLEALWSARLWQQYAFAIERLVELLDPSMVARSQVDAAQLLQMWTRALRLALGFPQYFDDPAVVTEKVTASLQGLLTSERDFAASRASGAVTTNWFRLVILPCLDGLVASPALLRLLLTLDLRTATTRLSKGRISSLRPITFANPLVEPVFAHVEDLLESVSHSYSKEVVLEFKHALVDVLQDSPLLQTLLAALDDPNVELRLEDPRDQLAANFLVYSSRARRCDHSRLQALYLLSEVVETWRAVYSSETARYSTLYSFESPVSNRPRVYMTYPHETLQSVMHQLGDDLAPLVEGEPEDAFPVPEMMLFDSVNLGQASRIGSLTVALAETISTRNGGGTLIFAPWLSLGGADAYCCTVANALAEQGRVSIYLTESSRQDGRVRLRNDVRVVDLSEFLGGHHQDDQAYALAMALGIVAPTRVINFNSKLLWYCLRKYHRRLAREHKIGCMFFCDDVDSDAVKHSYLRQNAGMFSATALWAIGDTGKYFESVCRELRLPQERAISIHFPPLQAIALATPKLSFEATHRILWAGRFDAQKRLDLLVGVARATPTLRFDVYGFPMLESDPALIEQLQTLANVRVCGAYSSFAEIDVEPYDALLVTTQWEGAPNIVLEAAARSLPVVAPRVGGIAELLDDSRGFLVERFDDVDEFAKQLRECVSDRVKAAACSDSLREHVRRTHTWRGLGEALAKLE